MVPAELYIVYPGYMEDRGERNKFGSAQKLSEWSEWENKLLHCWHPLPALPLCSTQCESVCPTFPLFQSTVTQTFPFPSFFPLPFALVCWDSVSRTLLEYVVVRLTSLSLCTIYPVTKSSFQWPILLESNVSCLSNSMICRIERGNQNEQ